jgi:hypothetical protein
MSRAGWLYGFQIVRARSIPPGKDQRASMPAMRRRAVKKTASPADYRLGEEAAHREFDFV